MEVSFCSVGKRLQKGLKLRLPNRQLQVEGDQRDGVPGTPSHEEEWRSLHILGLLLCRHQEVIKGESSRADRCLLWARLTETGDCPATPQKLESLSERGARKANSGLVDTQRVCENFPHRRGNKCLPLPYKAPRQTQGQFHPSPA